MSVGIDLTYSTVNLVTTSLIAKQEAETTCTSDGPSPKVVNKEKKDR
jgi:hypothetical protein